MIGQIGYLGKVSLPAAMRSILMYTVGATLGSAIVGLALGTLGYFVRWLFDLGHAFDTPQVLLPVALLALAGSARDMGYFRMRLPQPARQVPRGWMEAFGPAKTGFLWGFHVGLAYSTMVAYSLYYVVAFWILLAGSPALGAAAMALYGVVQGLVLTVDVWVTARSDRPRAGLFGWGRTDFFFQMGGAALLACGIFLAAQCGLFRLPPG